MADVGQYAGGGQEVFGGPVLDGDPTKSVHESYPEYEGRLQRRAQEYELREEMLRLREDKRLANALCARLSWYSGEGGRDEGAVETLDRLLGEVRAARHGPTPSPPQDGPHSAMLGQASGAAPYSPLGVTTGTIGVVEGGIIPRQRNVNAVGTDYDAGSLYASRPALNNPASTFTREAICAVIRAEKTRPQAEASLETLNRLQSIFENLE